MLDSKTLINHIRKNILQEIKDAGYPSIDAFALKNGLIKTTVYRAINGSRNPRILTLLDIAHALKIDFADLLDFASLSTSSSKVSRKTKKNTKS